MIILYYIMCTENRNKSKRSKKKNQFLVKTYSDQYNIILSYTQDTGETTIRMMRRWQQRRRRRDCKAMFLYFIIK